MNESQDTIERLFFESQRRSFERRYDDYKRSNMKVRFLLVFVWLWIALFLLLVLFV